MSEPVKTKIETSIHPYYRTILAGNLFAALRNGQFEFDVISESVDIEPTLSTEIADFTKSRLKRTIECKLVVSPLQLKAWIPFFQNHIDQYEAAFGSINLPAGPTPGATVKPSTTSPTSHQYT